MLQSTNKYKLYLYIIFFVFLSSIFNLKFLENYQDKFKLKKINITGLTDRETKIVQTELKNFINTNLFKLNKDELIKKLNNFNYLDYIYVNKVIPSSLNITLTKTPILGQTQKNGKNFYIGKNEKFINSNQLIERNKLPRVFGDFKIKDFLYLQSILKLHQIEINNIDKYFYFKNKRWDLLFSNGTILRLPSKNEEISITIYKKLLQNKKLVNTKIIDLRVVDQIILTN